MGGVVVMGKTETTKLQVAVVPAAFRTVQFTEVRPPGKREPEGGMQVSTGAGSQLSETKTVKFTGVEHWPAGAITAISLGHVIDGGWPATVTVCVQTVVLPLGSLAAQITFVVPNGKGEGALLMRATEPTASVAVGVPRFTSSEHWPAATFVVMSARQLSTGAVVSRTMMLKAR